MPNKGQILNPSKIIKHAVHSEIIICDRNKKPIAVALVDNDDLGKIKMYRWCLDSSGYPMRSFRVGKRKYGIRLHQVIFGNSPGLIIDHKNCNKLDSRKLNLRFVNRTQNAINRKSNRGVYYYAHFNRWVARIKHDKKQIHLGCFKTKDEAFAVRVKAEQKYFGWYAYGGE